MQHILGDADTLANGTSKAYTLTIDDKPLAIFVVHYRKKFYAYENQCPHTGVTLTNKSLIMNTTHVT